MENADPLIGRVIDRKYEIIEKIGIGGEATVYKAFQKNLERTVALKIINPSMRDEEEFIDKFIREAKNLAGIEHLHVVRIYDYGRDGNLSYIVMELLVGNTLDKVINRKKNLTIREIIDYMAPTADALQVIHDKGLIHRDIKSSNIFITDQDRPVLMDFGIAYSPNKTVSLYDLRATPQYMSPEHAAGKKLDGRSDLYSLGVVIYECLTGNVPFIGEDITSIIHKVIHEVPTMPPVIGKNTPKWLQALVTSLLSKEPANRIGTAREVSQILRNQSDTAKTFTVPILKGNKTVYGILASIGILIILAVILMFTTKGREKQSEIVSPSIDKNINSEDSRYLEQANLLFAENNFELAHRFFTRASKVTPGASGIENKLSICKRNIEGLIFSDYYVEIPSASFMMGNNSGGLDEQPEHEVELGTFRIGKYEITNLQYKTFLNALDCQADGHIGNRLVFLSAMNPAIQFTGDRFTVSSGAENFPVFGVTWYGADMFCREFGGRLPTEAEWEYLAMGNPPGNSPELGETAWYRSNSAENSHPVGSKRPNVFGLYDLQGNVWEWCSDNYQPGFYAMSAKNNPSGPLSGSSKVIRGGDFRSPAGILRPSYRSNANPDGFTGDFIGFRMVIPGSGT